MRHRAAPVAILAAIAMTAAAGCRGSPGTDDAASVSGSAAPASTCTKLGAPCTVSPGKLGTCVEVERPEGPSAFVCQSQH